jgi:voltage-gated potassium channel
MSGAKPATTAYPEVDPAYQVFMLCLCVWSLAVLAAGTFVNWNESTRAILEYADTAVCAFFFFDFLYSFTKSKHKLAYMASWGWIDLLSSIPALDALRWGRAARLSRILRVLRGVKSARELTHFVVERRAKGVFLASILVTLLLLVASSIAVLEFEKPEHGNIATAQDAMWWAISTMTTVGYGDRFPTTAEGRLVAVFLMAAGVGLFGTMSGVVASWFLSPAAKEADEDMREVKMMLRELQEQLSSRGHESSSVAARIVRHRSA